MVESSGGMRMAVSEKQMAYDKSTYQVFSFRIKSDSKMNGCLEQAIKKTGEKRAVYVRNALVRKLTKDGFLPPKE